MKRYSKEFYDVAEMFEKNVKELTYGHKVERVGKNDKCPASYFYNDGHINELFNAYMMGYELHKSLSYDEFVNLGVVE